MANTKKPIIAIAADVNIIAAQEDGEVKGPAKFDATFYTGGAMSIAGYDLPVVIDLAGLGRGNVLVANLDHDPTKRVGNFDVTNDGKSLVAHGTATASTDAKREVIESALEGYQWQASLEVSPHELQKLGKGKTAEVNGQTITGPAYITRKGTLKGFGFVSHGADDNTTVSIAASAASSKEKREMRAEVEKWIKATFPNVDIEAISDEETTSWESTYDVLNPKPVKASKVVTGSDAISKELREVKRREELDSITANFLEGIHAECKNEFYLNSIKELQDAAIEAGTSPIDYELQLRRNSVPVARPISVPSRDKQLTNEILEAAICQAGGLNNIDKIYSDRVLQAAHDRFKSRVGLSQIFRICAEANGHRCDSHNIDLDMQRAAFGMLPQQHASTGFSTLSLSSVIGTAAERFMLDGWGGGEQAWAAVSDITSVRNFNTITQYRLGGTLKYEQVGPGGEIKHGTISSSTYTLQADTYGKMFAVTRKDYINDDIGAMTQVPRELGYGASEAFNEKFWTVWLAATYSYTSAGAVSTAAVGATVAAAEAAFFALTKPNGEPVTIIPNVALMPNGSYRVMKDFLMSPVYTGGSSAVPAANSFVGDYNVVRSAYLSNSAYTGYSTIKWYLCAVRPGFAPIQVAFLNGQQNPTIETTSADFNTLGVQMRGVHDFGVSVMEGRAVVQGAGS